MSPIFPHCGWYILFQRKITYFLNMLCQLSQLDTHSACFMEDFYFCIAIFASLIARILFCLHMQTNGMFEIVLYADQINILHLLNQSALTWILQNRLNSYLWSFKDIHIYTLHHFNVLLLGRNRILPVNLLQNRYLVEYC